MLFDFFSTEKINNFYTLYIERKRKDLKSRYFKLLGTAGHYSTLLKKNMTERLKNTRDQLFSMDNGLNPPPIATYYSYNHLRDGKPYHHHIIRLIAYQIYFKKYSFLFKKFISY